MELTAALTGHFAAVTPLKPPVVGATQTYLERVQAFATLFWRLNEATGIDGFTEGVAGTLDFSADAAAQAALEYADATLAQDDSGGRCLGLSTHLSSGVTVLTRATNAAFDVTAGGWWCLFQADDLTDKHTLFARDDGAGGNGRFDLGVMPDGSLRSFRIDGTGAAKSVQSAAGLIVPGVSHLIGVDWGDAGLRNTLDGVVVANEATPTTNWATTTTAGIRVGRWHTGITGADGLIGWLMFRNSQPTAQEIAALARTQGVSLLNAATLPSVAVGQQFVTSIRPYGHFTATGLTVNEVSADPPNIDVTVSGEEVTITGVTEDVGETFDLSVTDGRGTTATRTFTIPVTAAPVGGEEFITTPELHGWDSSGTTLAKTTDFNQAISEANVEAF